jgi:glycosyltransferase involved in cell wall biosynthesis
LLPVFIRNSNAIVLERSSRLHISAVLLAKLFQRKLLLEWKDHLIDYESSLFKRLALFIEDIKIKFADCIIVESYVLQQLLIKRYPNKQFHVAYNAVELGHLNGEHLTVVRDRDIGFLYAGGYADYHDMLSLVDAAVLLAHRNLSFNFVCIGNGPHRAEMESKVIALGLQNYFTFVNSVSYDSLTEFYKRSVFGILPGCTEIICPIKVFEYMGFGLIPVIPDYLCNREVLSDDVAFYFEPINPRSIADTIEKCLSLLQNNGEYLDALSLENFRQAKEKFNWVATWGELIALKSLGIEYEFKKY